MRLFLKLQNYSRCLHHHVDELVPPPLPVLCNGEADTGEAKRRWSVRSPRTFSVIIKLQKTHFFPLYFTTIFFHLVNWWSSSCNFQQLSIITVQPHQSEPGSEQQPSYLFRIYQRYVVIHHKVSALQCIAYVLIAHAC